MAANKTDRVPTYDQLDMAIKTMTGIQADHANNGPKWRKFSGHFIARARHEEMPDTDDIMADIGGAISREQQTFVSIGARTVDFMRGVVKTSNFWPGIAQQQNARSLIQLAYSAFVLAYRGDEHATTEPGPAPKFGLDIIPKTTPDKMAMIADTYAHQQMIAQMPPLPSYEEPDILPTSITPHIDPSLARSLKLVETARQHYARPRPNYAKPDPETMVDNDDLAARRIEGLRSHKEELSAVYRGAASGLYNAASKIMIQAALTTPKKDIRLHEFFQEAVRSDVPALVGIARDILGTRKHMNEIDQILGTGPTAARS